MKEFCRVWKLKISTNSQIALSYFFRLTVMHRSKGMTFESALAFFFAVLVFGVTPGPGVFALMAKALVQGSRSCFAMALGMTIVIFCI